MWNPSSPEQSNRGRFPGGTSNGGDGTDQDTVGGELGTSRSMTAGQKKRLLGSFRRTKAMWLEEEKLQDIRIQCVDLFFVRMPPDGVPGESCEVLGAVAQEVQRTC